MVHTVIRAPLHEFPSFKPSCEDAAGGLLAGGSASGIQVAAH